MPRSRPCWTWRPSRRTRTTGRGGASSPSTASRCKGSSRAWLRRPARSAGPAAPSVPTTTRCAPRSATWMAEPVTLEAPAKLTVSLRITGVRDDGYHLIDAEMVSLDWGDTLTFSDGDGLVMVPDAAVPFDDDNLIRKALRAAGRSAQVRVEKRIPPGAGLGGGSADAAAVLRWAGIDDVEVAVGLGADVPFCVHGGRARVTGIGEVLEPLPYEV